MSLDACPVPLPSVKKELGHLFHVMAGFFFVYIVFAVLFGGFSDQNVYDSSYFFEILLLFHCVAFGNLIAIHVMTYLPVSYLSKFEQSGYQTTRQNSKLKSKRDPKLGDVLKDDYGCGVFMKVVVCTLRASMIMVTR